MCKELEAIGLLDPMLDCSEKTARKFEELYNNIPLLECGYTQDDIDSASIDDMYDYYSKEMQQNYGVVGIRIKCLNV